MFMHLKLKIIKRKIAIIILCILMPLGIGLKCAGEEVKADCGCQRLDKTYGSLYILFERTGISTEGGKKNPQSGCASETTQHAQSLSL